MKLTLRLALIVSIFVSPLSWASYEQALDSKTTTMSANRAVVFKSGNPICSVELNSAPGLAPSFVQIESSAAFPNYLPPCGQANLQRVQRIAYLAENQNQTAFLPLLVLVPVAICTVSAALGAWVTDRAITEGSPKSDNAVALTSTGIMASGAITATTAEIATAGSTVGAAIGGAIPVLCGLVGSAFTIGYVHFQSR